MTHDSHQPARFEPPRRPAVALPQRRLFLSCVTHEFRSYRDVLAANLAQPGVELRRQEDFVNAGRTTLEKLDEYIRTCDAVIHLVGDATGAYPQPAEVDTMLARLPGFADKLGLNGLLQPPGLSYTQWEAWLAVYHDKPLALYRAADVAQREIGFARDAEQLARQQQHWQCLLSRGRDRQEFVSPQELSIEVLRSLPLLVPGFQANVDRGEFRDWNLLFAVIALQNDILSHQQFVRVCKLWADDSTQLMADVMEREGLLTTEGRQAVESLLSVRLKRRGGDVRLSLAESLASDARYSLAEALDPATLASLPARTASLDGLEAEPGKWRYRLTRMHGVGGLGVVSQADDRALDRPVAVKQLRPERRLDPMAVERFVREARITGRLQHPNIVPVYELGLHPDDQIPFYSMRFVGHRTLHDLINRHYTDRTLSDTERNLLFREMLQSFLAVSNAVAYAHTQGVIHRDLKPANVMVGDFGEVILLDWGLAKRMDEPEPLVPNDLQGSTPANADVATTRFGAKLGTPAYMAPEQASGRVDLHGPHTDVYQLGATLYEILTGDVPFTGTSTDELYSVIESRPMPDPRERNHTVPAALVAICRKALEKQPADRYPSARALADDIEHWLADEPVSVLPETPLRGVSRWARKHRGLVGSAAAAIVLLAAVSSFAALLINAARDEALSLAAKETSARHEADEQRKQAEQLAREKTELADSERRARERSDRILYVAQIDQAQQAWQDSDARGAWGYLNRTDKILRGWEYQYLFTLFNSNQKTFRGHTNSVVSVAFSPDGQRIVTGSDDKALKLWDASTGQETLTLNGHASSVWSVAFSPDGKRIASGSQDETLKVWNASTGQETLTLKGHVGFVASVQFSPDGQRIVSGSWDKTIKLWDGSTGQETLTLKGHTDSVHSVAFSPDGARIVSGSSDQTLKVWDATTGHEMLMLKGHTAEVVGVAISPDGKRIVSGSCDGTLKIWDASTGQETLSLKGHTAPVRSVAFNPDGTRIVSGSSDHTLKVWDASTGQETLTLKGHTYDVYSVAYSPDGKRVASGSRDRTLKAWEPLVAQEARTLSDTSQVTSVAFGPDCKRIVSGGSDGRIKVWDATTGHESLTLKGHTRVVTSVAFSPDGQRIASGCFDDTLRVWDTATGQELLLVTLKAMRFRPVEGVAFSPDGKRIVSGNWDDTIRIMDSATGEEMLTLEGHRGVVNSVAFSPDGGRIVSGSSDETLKVWDPTTGQEMLTLRGHTGPVLSVAFSPSGIHVVSGSGDQTLKVWDVSTGHETLTLKGHTDSVHSVAFSPDGKRIVSGSSDKTLKLWDPTTGQETLTLKGHTLDVSSVAFCPDGKRIVSGGSDKTLRLWDASRDEE